MDDRADHVRLLAEHVSDIVLVGGADGRYEWASPSTQTTLGWHPDEVLGHSLHDFVHPEDAPGLVAVREAAGAGPMPTMELRWLCRDGTYRWVSARAAGVRGEDGTVINRVVVLREIDAEVEARALLAESERQYRMLAENASDVVYQTDAQRRLLWVSPSVERLLGWAPDDLIGTTVGDLLIEDANEAKDAYRAGVLSGSAVDVEARFRTADGSRRWMSVSAHPVLDQVGDVVTIIGALRDIDGEIKVRRALATLAASNSILVRADDEESLLIGTCAAALDAGEYVHASYQRSVGACADATDDHSPAALAVHSGEPIVLDHVEANPEMDAFRQRSTRAIASFPVRVDDRIDGALTIWAGDIDAFNARVIGILEELAAQLGYGLARLRDAERLASALHERSTLATELDREQADRRSLVDVLSHVRPTASLVDAAASVCDVLAALAGLGGAAIVELHGESAAPLAAVGPLVDGLQDIGRVTRDLIALQGDDVEWLDLGDPRTAHRIGASLHRPLDERGARSMASIRLQCQTGLLAGLTLVADGVTALRRPESMHDLGVLVAALLDPHVDSHAVDEAGRTEMRTVIDGHRFHSVFQPVVDLATMRTTKYEALTRFDSGTRPDLVFETAHRLGLGVDLERACALVALDTSRPLPAWVELGVNLSPPSILAGSAAEVAARAGDRQVIIEVTEHDAISDYEAIRRCLREAGLRVSIDDAGAGFAGLQHMLELQPDVVKLDIALVRGIDTDPVRQALAAGLCYFANETGRMLVAEGIETEAEAATVRRLGIHLAQGFLFGRPQAIDQR